MNLASGDVIGKLAKGSLLSRLMLTKKEPLRLAAVPRDHVAGDRARGDAVLAGRFTLGAETIGLTDFDFASLGADSRIATSFQGFSWLRDLAASTGRDKGARLAEAMVGRWLLAHGTKVDEAWRPALWGERILFWTAYAPYILSSRDAGYRSALLNTLARGARHLDATADKAPPGLERITAWAGVIVAGLLVQGGMGRVARGEAGLARALAIGQHDDGGLKSRSPGEQALFVDRMGLLRAAYFAAKQTLPDSLENAAAAGLAALHGVTMGDGGLSSWQGGNPGDTTWLTALVDGCGLRARPLRQARGGADQRLSALGPDARLRRHPRDRSQRRGATVDRQLRRPRRLAHRFAGRTRRRLAHHRRAQHAGARRSQLDRHPARRRPRLGSVGRFR